MLDFADHLFQATLEFPFDAGPGLQLAQIQPQ